MKHDDFLKVMELRKTKDSNLILHLFSNPHEYRECVRYYLKLLDDLGLLGMARRRNDNTSIDLTNGLKLELWYNKNIEKLYGYRYRTFRLFGNFDDSVD